MSDQSCPHGGPNETGSLGLCPACLLEVALRTDALQTPQDLDGKYRILNIVSDGEAGPLYVAEQIEQPGRLVAVKMLSRSADDTALRARLTALRDAVSNPALQGTGTLFETGTTRDGHTYVVMEYARGTAITRYCDRSGLSTRDRLNLMLRASQIVERLHFAEVVHGDIKPSTVLVSRTNHDENVTLVGWAFTAAPQAIASTAIDIRDLGTLLKTLVAAVPADPPELGAATADIIEKALQAGSDEGYAATAQFTADLRHILAILR